MEEVIAASAASDDEMKRLTDDFKRTKNILKEARDEIEKGFNNLSKEQDTLATKNSKCDVDISEILKIKDGVEIMSVTRDTLTQIKGARLEALFYGRWEKWLLRDGDRRIFLDINPACFQEVVDYLKERNINPPGSNLVNPYVGKDNDIFLQQLMLEFGLEGDRIIHYEKSVKKSKVREKKDKRKT